MNAPSSKIGPEKPSELAKVLEERGSTPKLLQDAQTFIG
jgi:hypothetical protein